MLRFGNMALAAAMLVGALPAAAVVPIAGLINSGQVAGGGAVTTGIVLENNWQLNVASVPWNSGVNGSFPIGPWLVEDSVSRWMTPASNVAADFDPVVDGFYDYSLNFDLTGYVPGTASFSGRFAADNQVTAITLNGNPINQAGLGGFTSWTDFSASSGFVAGQNQLVFTVRNEAGPGNPTGLRVEFQNSAVAPTAVPEPDGWAMFIAGFGLVGAMARRRQSPRLEDMGYIRC